MQKKGNRSFAAVISLLLLLAAAAGAAFLVIQSRGNGTLRGLKEDAFSENCQMGIEAFAVQTDSSDKVSVQISGWAIDKKSQHPFRAVYLSSNGKAVLLEKESRPDVSEAFDIQETEPMYGFAGEAIIKKPDVLKDDSVNLVFIQENGKRCCISPVRMNTETFT